MVITKGLEMTKSYYIKNAALGMLLFFITAIIMRDATIDISQNSRLIFLAVCGILFPSAKFTIESFALKFTSKTFWTTGFFENDTGMQGIKAIYFLICFTLAIPLSIIFFIMMLSKAGPPPA